MTHNRACPECGLIVEWTKGEQVKHQMPSGEITAYLMLLICPEHGEFEPRAHARLNAELSRVSKELGL
jgi:hypothetical protein